MTPDFQIDINTLVTPVRTAEHCGKWPASQAAHAD
jgi:hypothetical protein